MNIATKLTSSEVVREINLMQHFDWSNDQKEERILVMENALTVVKGVLAKIGLDDFNSRLYFSGQQGTIEHYLDIIKNLIVEDDNSKFIDENFQPFIYGKTDKTIPFYAVNIEIESVAESVETPNSLYVAYGLFAVWVLYLLCSIVLCSIL